MTNTKKKKAPKPERKKRAKKPKYRSKFEKRIADELASYHVVFAYEGDKLPYTVPESKHVYMPDFKIGAMYIECKGLLDLESRKKMILIKQQYPDLDIRMVFMRNNPIRKGSTTKYSDWAEQYGFKYAIGSAPIEWFTE